MKRYVTAALVFMITAELLAQSKPVSVIHHGIVAYAAVDRPGDLYLVLLDKTITRYDVHGKSQKTGKLPFMPTVFDPHDGSRLFAYDQKSTSYVFFSPSFDFSRQHKVDSVHAISPYLACAAGDRDMVILDSADWSLKKINISTGRVLFESFPSGDSVEFAKVTFMREYQHFVFMLEAGKGIRIFNMLGKLLRSVDAPDADYFNFLGEEVYYLDGNTLRFFNLFTTESRSMPLPYSPIFALLTDERLYLTRTDKTEVFSIKR